METKKTIFRVFLIEPNAAVRRPLARLIDAEPDLIVCGEADGVEEALARISACDVIAINVDALNMPLSSAVGRLRRAVANIPLVAISLWEDATGARRILEAGFSGYVPKAEAAVRIVPALQGVLRGQTYPSRSAKNIKKGGRLP